MHRLQKVNIIILLAITVSLSAQEEDMIINMDTNLDSGCLTFENPKGSISITGYDGDIIIISARARLPLNNEKFEHEGFQKIDQPAYSLSAEVKNNNVLLLCNSYSRTIDFIIQLPAWMSLKVKSLDNGDIDIYRVDGEIEAENENGDIIVNSILSSAVLTSTYGNISTSFREIRHANPIMLSSFEGDIELILPEKTDANLMMRSQRGEILSELDINIEKRKPKIISDSKGSKYELENWTRGKLNKGGADIIISNYFGNIIIKKK